MHTACNDVVRALDSDVFKRMIDGSVTAQDADLWVERLPYRRIRRAEECDCRHAERGGKVRHAGIVADVDGCGSNACRCRDEFLVSHHRCAALESGEQRLTVLVPFDRTDEEHRLESGPAQPFGQLTEIRPRPALVPSSAARMQHHDVRCVRTDLLAESFTSSLHAFGRQCDFRDAVSRQIETSIGQIVEPLIRDVARVV